MNEKDVKELLQTIGIGTGIITAIFLVGLGAIAYRNYYQIKLYKKQVTLIDRQLASGKV